MLRIPARGRRVTAEPLTVAPHLLDAPLASFRRRLVAYALDLLLFGVVAGSCFLALSAASIHREDPSVFPRLRARMAGGTTDEEADRQLSLDLLRLVVGRAPGALPHDLEQAILAEEWERIEEKWDTQDLTLTLGSGRTTLDRGEDRMLLKLGSDVWLGEFAGFYSWGAVFVGWFTLWTRWGRGRTPGKWALGLRVVRLDGRALGWWTAFSRAGGYSASAATLLLGFLEMIWDPNRQALHDRVAATVVLRGRTPPGAPAA